MALSDTCAPVVGLLFEEGHIVTDPDQRPRVAVQRDDRERTEDAVDGTPLEAELAQVRTGEQRFGGGEQLGGGRAVMIAPRVGSSTQSRFASVGRGSSSSASAAGVLVDRASAR